MCNGSSLCRVTGLPPARSMPRKPLAWLEDHEPLQLQYGWATRIGNLKTGCMPQHLASIAFHRLQVDFRRNAHARNGAAVLPSHLVAQGQRRPVQDEEPYFGSVERGVLDIAPPKRDEDHLRLRGLGRGGSQGDLRRQVQHGSQQRVLVEVERTLEKEGKREIWERGLEKVNWTNGLESHCLCSQRSPRRVSSCRWCTSSPLLGSGGSTIPLGAAWTLLPRSTHGHRIFTVVRHYQCPAVDRNLGNRVVSDEF